MIKTLINALLATAVYAKAKYAEGFAPADYEKGMVGLTDKNWNDEMAKKSNELIMVEFYNPWCHFCKKFKPNFDEAAKEMLQFDPPVPMGMYNTINGKVVDNALDVRGTPGVRIFYKGKQVEVFHGFGSKDYMVHTMKMIQMGLKADPTKYDDIPHTPIDGTMYDAVNPFNQKYNDLALEGHNKFRKLHGVPLLTLDESAMKTAQTYANKMHQANLWEHSPLEDRNGCGENLAKHSNRKLMWNTNVATQMWYDEIDNPGYDFNNHGYYQNPGAGHFTALIWKKTTKLGCGIAGDFVVCHYCEETPNIIGNFEENVLPPNGKEVITDKDQTPITAGAETVEPEVIGKDGKAMAPKMPLIKATVNTDKAECKAMTKSLGVFKTAEKCSLAAYKSDCKYFMWSKAYPEWGCTCCDEKKQEKGEVTKHKLWNVYEPTPYVKATVAHAKAECRAQTVNLGEFNTAEECGLEAYNKGCQQFMWSKAYPMWGCRCCQQTYEHEKEGEVHQHNLWNIYEPSTRSDGEDELIESLYKEFLIESVYQELEEMAFLV